MLVLEGILDGIHTNHFTLLMTKWRGGGGREMKESKRERRGREAFSTTQWISDLSPRLCPLNPTTLDNQIEGQIKKQTKFKGSLVSQQTISMDYNSNARSIKVPPLPPKAQHISNTRPYPVLWNTGLSQDVGMYLRKEGSMTERFLSSMTKFENYRKRFPLYSMLVWSRLDQLV